MKSQSTGITYRRNPIPKLVRQEVYDAADGKCTYCGMSFADFPKAFTVDHIKHKYCGGTDKRSNLIAACRKCNAARWEKSVEEHMEYMKKRLREKGPWNWATSSGTAGLPEVLLN